MPDVPDFGKPITIAHLLHHTSGLRDWPETLSLSDMDLEGPISLDVILEMVRCQRELDFAPGEEFSYSNTGYNLLATAVAKVTGQSFRAWCDANIFRPLGMKHTQVCDNSAEVVADRADCYNVGEKGKFHRVNSQLSAQGSSSLFITAEDMAKWLLNFETARVGGRAAIEMMRQPGKLNGGEVVRYGFGLDLGQFGLDLGKRYGSPVISHGGGWAGYRSFVIYIPEKRFGVAILSNAGNVGEAGLAVKIADLYLRISPEKPADPSGNTEPGAVKSDPATWDPFLGTYRLGPNLLLTITREGDQLMAQGSREDKVKMTPISERSFYVEAFRAPVEFGRENGGQVTNLLYRGINAPKLSVPELTSGRLAEYVGDYWSEELRLAGRIEIKDGKLASHQRSGNWVYLMPTETDRFDAADGFVLEFTRNPVSEITGMRVSGDRVRRIRYKRVKLP